MTARYEVALPGDSITTIEISPAKHPGLWWHGFGRMMAMLRRDRSFWLTVDASDVPRAILKERYRTEAEAHCRALELVRLLENGAQLSRRPHFGRRSNIEIPPGFPG